MGLLLLLLPVLRGVGAGKGRARPLEGRPQALVGYHNMELACAKVDRHHHQEVDRRASSFKHRAYIHTCARPSGPPPPRRCRTQRSRARAPLPPRRAGWCIAVAWVG